MKYRHSILALAALALCAHASAGDAINQAQQIAHPAAAPAPVPTKPVITPPAPKEPIKDHPAKDPKAPHAAPPKAPAAAAPAPAATSTSNAAANAAAQAQAASIARGGNASSTLQSNGNGAGAGANAGAGAGFNGQIAIQGDQAGSGDTYKSFAIGLSAQVTPPTAIAGANVTAVTGACGPMVEIIRTPVTGTFIGFFADAQNPQGYTERMEDYSADGVNPTPYIAMHGRWFGHQVTQYAAVVSVGGARSASFSGWGAGGPGGSIGGGASGANQQMVYGIQKRLCDTGMAVVNVPQLTYTPPTNSPAAAVAVPARYAAPVVAKPARKRQADRKSAPVAAAPAAEACVETATMACRRPPVLGLKLN